MSATQNFKKFLGLNSDQAEISWTAIARARMYLAEMSEDSINQVMAEPEKMIRKSGEKPEDIFGDPRTWADQKIVEASQQQATFLESRISLSEATSVALATSGVFALVAFVLSAFSREWLIDWSIGVIVFPLGIGLLTVGSLLLREWLVRRVSTMWSIVLTACIMCVIIFALVSLLQGAASLGWHSNFWFLAQAALFFILSSLAYSFMPHIGPKPIFTSLLSDEQWLMEARTRLRDRGDLTEKYISQTLEEAVSHAAESGNSLAKEFGNPVGYARSLPGSKLTSTRRQALLWTALCLISSFANFDFGTRTFSSWWTVAGTAALGALALYYYVRWYQLSSARKDQVEPSKEDQDHG